MAPIPEVWIPALTFGNVFAFFWIFMMLLAYSPTLSRKVDRIFGFKKKGKVERRPSIVEGDFRPPVATLESAKQRSTAKDLEAAASLGPDDDPTPSAVERRMSRVPSASVQRVTLEWTKIGCTYRAGATDKVVLQDVYGKALPNEMLALMGPSGAGKSTLLDILTMRKSTGTITGEVMANGEGRQTNFLRMSSYVPQEDNFVPTMTTHETLTFYAKLVLPRDTTSKDLRKRVNEVLAMVGLWAARSTMVGGQLPGGIHLRGLSGGERRRLSIAVGVVSAPSIIFLDEPTSGLDSFAALNVMQYMKSMAELRGHTIIASIHQPRIGIWNMFNKTVILSKGHLMYWGPTQGVAGWFSGELGYPYDAAIHGVVSDWVMDLVSIGFSKPEAHYGKSMRTEAELLQASNAFLNLYLADLKKQQGSIKDIDVTAPETSSKPSGAVLRRTTTHFMVDIEEAPASAVKSPRSNGMSGSGETGLVRFKRAVFKTGGYNSSWFTQFCALWLRSFLNITRNPTDVAGRMLTFSYISLFIGLIFYDLPEDASSLQTRLNIVYNSVAFFMFIPYVSMSLFTSDRQFYSADVSARLYHPSAYYVANVLSNVPFAIANAAVFAFVVYGMAGLRDDTEIILKHVALLVLQSLIALQVLHFAAVVTHNQDTAFMLAIAFTAVNILLSNYFIPFSQVEFDWIAWLQYLSAMAYTFEGLVQLEFSDRTFDCSQGIAFLGANSTELLTNIFPNVQESQPAVVSPLVTGVLEDPGEDCIVNGGTINDFFDLDKPYWLSFGILAGYLGVLHTLTFMGLSYLAKKDKR